MPIIDFTLEVDNRFNLYDFFAEFKRLQFQGNFKEVQRIKRLQDSAQDSEISKAETIIKESEFIAYGVR